MNSGSDQVGVRRRDTSLEGWEDGYTRQSHRQCEDQFCRAERTSSRTMGPHIYHS